MTEPTTETEIETLDLADVVYDLLQAPKIGDTVKILRDLFVRIAPGQENLRICGRQEAVNLICSEAVRVLKKLVDEPEPEGFLDFVRKVISRSDGDDSSDAD